jgi:predicted RNA-binding Zn ribbon-like protein
VSRWPTAEPAPAAEFTLLGDAVWLDFVNSGRGRVAPPADQLPDRAAFERWCLMLQLEQDPAIPFELVIRFRQQLTLLGEALHAGLQPPATAIAAINEQLARSAGANQLIRVRGEWRLRFSPCNPPDALIAIARSAAATLTDPLLFVRRCAAGDCSLFFTDSSPNGSRRWCSAAVCGQFGRIERRRGLVR